MLKVEEERNLYMQKDDVPTYDYFENKDLSDHGDLEAIVEHIIDDFEEGYFLAWDAVICEEQGRYLNVRQKETLSELLDFSENGESRILYIDDLPRPSEPWYEIVKKVVPYLLIDQFITYQSSFIVITEGWPKIAYEIEENGKYLTLPEGIENPIDIIPVEIQHKLWIQSCLDDFSGIGQKDELTLSNKERNYIDDFIESLEECKDSVDFLDLSLQKILKILIFPHEEEKIFIRRMIMKLGLSSTRDLIAEYL